MKEVTFSFKSKIFIVTGTTSGIGRQITIELLEAGAIVLGIGRNTNRLDELAQIYESFSACCLDISNYEELEKKVEAFIAANGKVDGLVHAAGVVYPTPLRSYNENKAYKIMDISFWAGIKLLQIVNRKRNSNPGCSSILFSSVAGYVGAKTQFAYAGAKAAVQVAVKTLAKEVSAQGNRINTVSPGWVETEMTAHEKETSIITNQILSKLILGEGYVEDISGMVLFLLSNRARWITGTDIVIDGGYLLGGE